MVLDNLVLDFSLAMVLGYFTTTSIHEFLLMCLANMINYDSDETPANFCKGYTYTVGKFLRYIHSIITIQCKAFRSRYLTVTLGAKRLYKHISYSYARYVVNMVSLQYNKNK